MRRLNSPPIVVDLLGDAVNSTPRPNWSRTRKTVRAFVEWMAENQRGQCAFCGFEVGDRTVHRAWSVDHLAPKAAALYPQWTFEPLNLFITCTSCNSVLKRDYDSVQTVAPRYENSVFRLVHPYLDDVETHLTGTYTGLFDQVVAPCVVTLKGRRTVKLFALDDVRYLRAINGQAEQLQIAKWRETADPTSVALFKALLNEVQP
jgi:uncharacterized protein (TIGR02646 family)